MAVSMFAACFAVLVIVAAAHEGHHPAPSHAPNSSTFVSPCINGLPGQHRFDWQICWSIRPQARRKIAEVEGGIPFVDEAYQLTPSQKEDETGYEIEAPEEIMYVMNNGKVDGKSSYEPVWSIS
ncbi:hypothetical protein H0E87_018420 [Populus deltoides]|uniref:Uncharacterized protein n=1 Tax=Populus deltoides TaxID=3696 RepID=A0A8T2XRC0_POPDE|nr:hypothetical protein H0E87_018420 [Populus deltoides]